jgi:acetyl-CoA acetyltransferase
MGLRDCDFSEIHEAFAVQTLATLKAWELPEFCWEREYCHRAFVCGNRGEDCGIAGEVAGAAGIGKRADFDLHGGGMGVTVILERGASSHRRQLRYSFLLEF